jgi:hypothetical protein
MAEMKYGENVLINNNQWQWRNENVNNVINGVAGGENNQLMA